MAIHSRCVKGASLSLSLVLTVMVALVSHWHAAIAPMSLSFMSLHEHPHSLILQVPILPSILSLFELQSARVNELLLIPHQI